MTFPRPTTDTCRPPVRQCHAGSILLLVLVVVAMLALSMSSFSLQMQNEHRAARQAGRQQQALRLADSGVAYLRALLAQDDGLLLQQGGLLDNPDLFQGLLVFEDAQPAFRGRFTVLAPSTEGGQEATVRYGLENESAKLNLNALVAQKSQAPNRSGRPGPSPDSAGAATAAGDDDDVSARQRLLALPGMDVNLADAILDYLDADDVTREYGAEQDYYQQLDPPSLPANGPLVNLDQLLQVRGVTPALLYGTDTNRNAVMDPEEGERTGTFDMDEGTMNRGWAAYLTVVSGERVLNPDGEGRIDINSTDLQKLSNKLSGQLNAGQVNFIIALRQYGPRQNGQQRSQPLGNRAGQTSAALQPAPSTASGPRPGATGPAAKGQTVAAEQLSIDFKKRASYQLATLLDLVGVGVEIPGRKGAAAKIVESPWPDTQSTYQDDWLKLMDQIQIGSSKLRLGRINIQLASKTVLQTLEPLSDSVIESILSLREAVPDTMTGPQRHPSWLLARGLVTLDVMKKLMPQITCRGDVFRGQVVGYFESGRPMARFLVTFDRIDPQPRLVGWRDLSSLGPSFSAEFLGAEEADARFGSDDSGGAGL